MEITLTKFFESFKYKTKDKNLNVLKFLYENFQHKYKLNLYSLYEL